MAALKKQGYVILNAMRRVLKDVKLGHYTYETLMKVDIMKEYTIYTGEIWELIADAGKSFVE
jgi:hypothetical protein